MNLTTVHRLDRGLTIAIIIIVKTKTPTILLLGCIAAGPGDKLERAKESSEPAAISLIFVLTRNLLP